MVYEETQKQDWEYKEFDFNVCINKFFKCVRNEVIIHIGYCFINSLNFDFDILSNKYLTPIVIVLIAPIAIPYCKSNSSIFKRLFTTNRLQLKLKYNPIIS